MLGSSSSSQENSHASAREELKLKTEKEELDPMLAPGGARLVPIKKRSREDRLREDAELQRECVQEVQQPISNLKSSQEDEMSNGSEFNFVDRLELQL